MLKEKLLIILINTLLLYIPLLALTDGQNYRETNTLATRGLEEPFFQLCCCVSFWFCREIGFCFTYYLCNQSTIHLWCCVKFFKSGGKQFLVLCKYLVYNTVVRLCQFFCFGGKANLVQIFLLNPFFFIVHRNKYLEGFDDGQKTPRGRPNFSFLREIQRVSYSRHLSGKHSFTLLSQPLLTDRKTDRESKTLAARGLEEFFFQLCCCFSFWFQGEIGFGFIYYVLMYLEYHTVVVLCQFFGSGGKQFLVLRMYLV